MVYEVREFEIKTEEDEDEIPELQVMEVKNLIELSSKSVHAWVLYVKNNEYMRGDKR